MGKTSIEWTKNEDGSDGRVWNPVRGCLRVSPGCGGPGKFGGCYAERIAARFSGPGEPFEGYAERRGGEARWTGKVGLIEDKLTEPLTWRKPTRVFVNSMSDLFHEGLPDEAIDRVFAVMALAPQHEFMILTKRSARMREYMTERHDIIGEKIAFEARSMGVPAMNSAVALGGEWVPDQIGDEGRVELSGYFDNVSFPWPLPNVMLGVSCEDQTRADERIPDLLATPAAIRFVSAEPLLSGIRFDRIAAPKLAPDDDAEGWKFNALDAPSDYYTLWDEDPLGPGERCVDSGDGPYRETRLDLVIVGAESGPRARPMDLQWARNILAQCRSAGVACFVKQLSGPGGRAIKDMAEFPSDLRVREFPRDLAESQALSNTVMDA
jgi:protein gp37